MDFRAHQDMARRLSRRVWLGYILLLLTTSALIGLSISLLWSMGSIQSQVPVPFSQLLRSAWLQATHPLVGLPLTLGASGGALLIILLSTLVGFFRNSNGHQVARHFGGRLLNADSSGLTLAEQRALNLVQELSLAAQIPPPAVYVLPESGINAFAAGRDPQDAVVAITQGALDSYTRDELAAVIAHELGHIANEDIRLNIRVAAFVLGFTSLSFIARSLLRAATHGRGDGRLKLILILLALVIGVIGALSVLSGRILQALMSQQREFLADASAVQYTRNPKGLIDALLVIHAGDGTSRVSHPEAAEYSHAFLFSVSSRLFDTHPPLPERIRRLQTGQLD